MNERYSAVVNEYSHAGEGEHGSRRVLCMRRRAKSDHQLPLSRSAVTPLLSRLFRRVRRLLPRGSSIPTARRGWLLYRLPDGWMRRYTSILHALYAIVASPISIEYSVDYIQVINQAMFLSELIRIHHDFL